MTTYTLTLTHTDDNGEANGEQDVYSGLTIAQVRQIAKRNCSSIATWAREKAVKEAPKSWYYRGKAVALVEEVTNGYTLVNYADSSRFFVHAITDELEYR